MSLTEEELTELKRLRLTEKRVSSELSVPLHEIMNDREGCLAYLQRVKEEVGAPNDKVAVSILMKRYAFLPAIYLYAMTVWNKRLNITFENVSIESSYQGDLWLPSFCFNDLSFFEASEPRHEWRREAVAEVFAKHIFPLMNAFVRISKISKYILWENIAVYIFWLYESFLNECKDDAVRERAVDDFQFIVKHASGELFGDYHQNPLTKYYTKSVYNKEQNREVRVRTTCCFTNQLKKNMKSCNICPVTCNKLK